MARFIEVSKDGEKFLINIDNILTVDSTSLPVIVDNIQYMRDHAFIGLNCISPKNNELISITIDENYEEFVKRLLIIANS